MLINHTEYKYKTPYKCPFLITQCFTNGTAKLQFGLTKNRYNIRWIKPHKPDTKVEDYYSINISDGVSI